MVYANFRDKEIAVALGLTVCFVQKTVRDRGLPSGQDRRRARCAEARAAEASEADPPPVVSEAPEVPSVPVSPAIEDVPGAPTVSDEPTSHEVVIVATPRNDVKAPAKIRRAPAPPPVRPSLPAQVDVAEPAAFRCRCGRIPSRGKATCPQFTPRLRDGWKAAARNFAMPENRATRRAREAEVSKAVRDAERARLLRELPADRIVRIPAPAYIPVAVVATNDVLGGHNEITTIDPHIDEM